MHTPYTSNFGDAYSAAHSSISIALSAVLWHQRERPIASRATMQAAVALAVVAPMLSELEMGIGLHPAPTSFVTMLKVSAALATIATLLAGRVGAMVWALAGEVVLYLLTGFLTDSNLELLSLHTAWFGLLIGLQRLPSLGGAPLSSAALERRYPGDLVLFGLATAAAAAVGSVVLQRMIGSSDEWAYTYQAAVFAKLRAYAQQPSCTAAYQSFWVFPYMGKQFSQYTPGWPYFMTPFVWLGVPWLAGSFALGLLVVGVARLTRRAMVMGDTENTTRASDVQAAGVGAALALTASSTVLVNGGSRFPHVFVLANFVWALEALFHLATPSTKPSHPQRWAAVLGVTAALLLATRPTDGAGLGVGLFVYFVYALVRRRFAPSTVLMVAAAFAVVGGITLVVLRAQLGRWFTTGYSLNSIVHPWNKFEISTPKPDQWRWGFPLATGAYGWWPCSLALGLAGLASLGRRGRALNATLLLSLAPVLVFYALLDLGRGYDWGYGPRYQMVLMVPMAVGTGVVVGRLFHTARRRRAAPRTALTAGGPLAVLLLAAIVGVVRIAPLVYPFDYASVFNENHLQRAIHDARLHGALVLAAPGTGGVDPMDLTQNLPLDLYPNQDVIVAVTRSPVLERCVIEQHPERAIYRASGSPNVTLRRER